MVAPPQPTPDPWVRRQFGDDDPLIPIFPSPDDEDTTTTSASSTRTTSSSTRTTSSSSSTLTTTSSTSTTTSSTTSSTTTSSTSTTISSTLTTSTPTIVTSTSQSRSGTSTVNVVITQTTLAPATTTVTRPTSLSSNSGDNGPLVGGVVGGVVGGLALIALIIAICITASRRKSRTGHAYFLCFGERPSKAEKGDLGHGGGAWPTFDPNDDHGAGYGAAAAAGGAAAASSRRRRRQPQTHATLPPGFVDEDPEAYGRPDSSAGHDAYGGYSQAHDYNNTGYSQGHDNYNGYSQGHSGGHHEMAEAGALAGAAAAGGAYYNSQGRRRSSNGHHYGPSSNDALSSGHVSSEQPQAPAPWTMPMLGGWTGDHGPYSAAGVGRGPQAFHMMGPGEGGQPRNRPPGPDYSHFDPPEVRDARAREAAAAALASGSSYPGSPQNHPSTLTPGSATSPRQNNRRLSSNNGSPSNENGVGGSALPPAYVDASEDIEEVGDEQPRRLHLTNAEPDETDDDSSRGGPTRPAHNHKDRPPVATHRPK